jgi:tetratricopeptide (TPR) repeat protein
MRGIGQEAQVKISGNPNLRGWRKLDSGPVGFSVKRGFSGAPAMDELGNTVWGMIATVDAAGERVSFAITADDLRMALRSAGAVSTTGVRIEDDADVDARQAMITLREQVAGMEVEFQQKQQEIARLQEMVRSFEQRERSTPGAGPERRALQSLAEGDTRPATEILRERIRQQRAEAASASRQLGSLLSLTNSADALNAYREAALLDPDDFWTLMEVGNQERLAGLQSLAAEAYQRAYDIAARLAETDPHNTQWHRNLSVSHEKIGEVRRALGDQRGALDAHQQSLEIRARLLETDPGNTEWQRDLSVSYARIGDVRRAQGDLRGALEAYNQSLEIRARLAQLDPSNALWQQDLARARERMAQLEKKS